MLTELYIEALLVDEELADQVPRLWVRGVINDELAATAWSLLFLQDSRVVGVESG